MSSDRSGQLIYEPDSNSVKSQTTIAASVFVYVESDVISLDQATAGQPLTLIAVI